MVGPDAEKQRLFAERILRIGDGREITYTDVGVGYIKLPDEMCLQSQDVNDLITTTFPNMEANYNNIEYWCKHAILTPLNDDVEAINEKITSMLPGEARDFYSADRCVDSQEASVYPVEFLNTLNPSGIPRHKLTLKVGMIIMLMRSISGRLGLYNGTKLVIRAFGSRTIQAEIVSGRNIGARVFIPRIPLVPSDSGLPFQFE